MKTSEFKPGMVVWLDCEVRSGPFSNERRVFIKLGDNEWFGFVNETELQNKVGQGKDRVKSVVLSVQPDVVVLGVRGQSPASGPIHTDAKQIYEHGAIEA